MTISSSSTRRTQPLVKKFSPVIQEAMAHYAQLSKDLSSHCDNPAVVALREQARARFLEQGFPTRRDEDWGYTKLNAFVQNRYQLQGISQLTQADIQAYLPTYPALRIIMVDGYFSENLSDDLSGLPKGVHVEAVTDVLSTPSLTDKLTGFEGQIESEPFGVVNSMLLNDGYFIQIGANITLELPLFVLHVQTQNNHVSNLRNRVVVESNAEITLVESYVSLPRAQTEFSGWTNVVTEIDVGESARVKQVILQDQAAQSYYFNNQFIEQASRSVFDTLYAGIGSLTARHQNHLLMNGEQIESNQSSACYANGKQQMDSRTYTEHNQVGGMSRQLHKFVLDGQSVGVFNGMIKVAQAAQKTDGQMDNKNLLLSAQAQMDSKPQLEIYADDVKCSHGSATGQISQDQIFYLQARGIPKVQAVRMITEAFLLEPLENVSHPAIRAWLSRALSNTLNG